MPALPPPPPPAAAPPVPRAASRAADRPAEVAPVVVTAIPRDPPALAASWPAQGAAVAPGTMVLKLAFSQPMRPGRWAYGPAPGAPYPRCLDRPRLLADQRTFVLLCVTGGKGPWTVRLNPANAPDGQGGADGSAGESGGGGFVAVGGRVLAPLDLSFSTTDDTPVASLEDAMKVASLAEDQGPVMGERTQEEASTPAAQPSAAPPPPLAPPPPSPRSPPRPPRGGG